MQNQDLIYRKQYMRQLQNLKDQNIIKGFQECDAAGSQHC